MEDTSKTGINPETQKCPWLTKERQRSQSPRELSKDECESYLDFSFPDLESGGASGLQTGSELIHTASCSRSSPQLKYMLLLLRKTGWILSAGSTAHMRSPLAEQIRQDIVLRS